MVDRKKTLEETCLKTQKFYTSAKIGGIFNETRVCYYHFKDKLCPYLKIKDNKQICDRYKHDTTTI